MFKILSSIACLLLTSGCANNIVSAAAAGFHDNEVTKTEKLSIALSPYGLIVKDTGGGGNCQFHSIGDRLGALGKLGNDGLPLTKNSYEFLRKEAVNHINRNRKAYNSYILIDFNTYLAKMGHTTEWGDHITLLALSRIYGVNIIVIDQHGKVSGNIKCRDDWKNTVVLGHVSELHYVAAVRSPYNKNDKSYEEAVKLLIAQVSTGAGDRVVTVKIYFQIIADNKSPNLNRSSNNNTFAAPIFFIIIWKNLTKSRFYGNV